MVFTQLGEKITLYYLQYFQKNLNMIEKKLKLNKSQKEAVEFENGELLVVAGAGAGKTNVITQRIKHLIEERNVNPNDILALTFTEKAAQEMLNRVDDVMPLGYTEPWVNTFHSFADKILREEGLEIGLDPGYKILSSSEQWLLFRRHLFEFELFLQLAEQFFLYFLEKAGLLVLKKDVLCFPAFEIQNNFLIHR